MIAQIGSIIATRAGAEIRRKANRAYQDSLLYAFMIVAFSTCFLFATVALFIVLTTHYGPLGSALIMSGLAFLAGCAAIMSIRIIRHRRRQFDRQHRTSNSSLLATGALLSLLSRSPSTAVILGIGLAGLTLLMRHRSSDEDEAS